VAHNFPWAHVGLEARNLSEWASLSEIIPNIYHVKIIRVNSLVHIKVNLINGIQNGVSSFKIS